MAPVSLSDDQIKALILNYLVRRRCWGAKYLPRQKLVRHLGYDVLGDGKEVSRCLDELLQSRWLNSYKKRKTIHLNVSHKRDIFDHLEKHNP